MMKIKKVVSITNLCIDHDSGLATEIRIKFIHKGLKENGYEISVFSYITKQKGTNSNYIFANLKSCSFGIKLLYFLFWNPILFFFFLIRIDRDSIILIDKLPFNLVVPLFLFKLIKGNKVVSIYNEFFVQNVISNSIFHSFIEKVKYIFWILLLKYSDVLIVISEQHSSYFKKYLRKTAEVVVIPILLDYDKKEEVGLVKSNKIFSICYAGALSKSNGVELLIESISYLSLNNVLLLTIFGPSFDDYRSFLQNKIDQLKLSDIIILDYPKSNNETKEFLKTQDLLVIPKLDDTRALGYIPSKLGDFLYSSTPILVSDVGEINKHIVDGYNGYLFNPTIKKDLSRKILNIINSDKCDVGKNGHLYSEIFHYSIQVKDLIKVI